MSYESWGTRALSALLDLLAPALCAACDGPSGEATFCLSCGGAHSCVSEQSMDGVPLLAAGVYATPLSTAISRFKYEGRAELARPLARLLAPRISSRQLPDDAVLVPVPLHPRRLASRGYNQAALLARELARLTRRGCLPRLLRRLRETERQVGKSRAERRENPAGAFVVRGDGPVRVVLVDDVVTTGSTVRACAQALAAAGIELSAIVALAHADGR